MEFNPPHKCLCCGKSRKIHSDMKCTRCVTICINNKHADFLPFKEELVNNSVFVVTPNEPTLEEIQKRVRLGIDTKEDWAMKRKLLARNRLCQP